MFDWQEIWYSDVGAVGNPIQNLFQCPTAGQGGTDFESCLGGNRGAGFGWEDMKRLQVRRVLSARRYLDPARRLQLRRPADPE